MAKTPDPTEIPYGDITITLPITQELLEACQETTFNTLKVAVEWQGTIKWRVDKGNWNDICSGLTDDEVKPHICFTVSIVDPSQRELGATGALHGELPTANKCPAVCTKEITVATAQPGSYKIIVKAWVGQEITEKRAGFVTIAVEKFAYAFVTIWTDDVMVVNRYPISSTEKPKFIEYSAVFDKI